MLFFGDYFEPAVLLQFHGVQPSGHHCAHNPNRHRLSDTDLRS